MVSQVNDMIGSLVWGRRILYIRGSRCPPYNIWNHISIVLPPTSLAISAKAAGNFFKFLLSVRVLRIVFRAGGKLAVAQAM
jgi:hypothetical protein